MPSKSVKNCDLFNTTVQSTYSCLGDAGADDVTEKLKQLRARNKTLKDERDQIGHEYDEMKLQLEKSEADRKQLLAEKEGLNSKMDYLRRGHEESDTLRARITEIQKENGGLKAEVSMLKSDKDKLKTDNEKLTSNLMMAIDEKGSVEGELNDIRSQLREAKRKLNDEINIFTHSKEKSQKEAKQRTEEIARLKESCNRMELELSSQRVEFTAQLKHRDTEIEELEKLREHLQNEIDWLKANNPPGGSVQCTSRVDENGLLLPDSSEESSETQTSEAQASEAQASERDFSNDESTIVLEDSKLEDLDDFFDKVQKHRGKGMKEQSADPDLLSAFGRSEPVRSPCKSADGSRKSKSPKCRPSMLRRMSTFFFPPPE